MRRPEPLHLPGVHLLLVEVGHVLRNVELGDGNVMKVLAESLRVDGEHLHRPGQVRKAAIEVVKVAVTSLKRIKWEQFCC